jgi:hypothetical protein
VELRRNRRSLLPGVVFLAVGALLPVCLRPDRSVGAWLLTGVAVLIGVALVGNAVRPFRFHIGAGGLSIRHNGLDRAMPWAEIEAVVLDQPPPSSRGGLGDQAAYLLLVPAAPVDLGVPLDRRSPLTDRPARQILEFAEVRESAGEVADALTRFGGERFTDLRALRAGPFGAPDFVVALRGYDIEPVDRLIRRAQEALLEGSAARRREARREIDEARGNLAINLRGYDRAAVDAYLADLSAGLAE